MGTPRALTAPNQMRRIQISASVAGACEKQFALKRSDLAAGVWSSSTPKAFDAEDRVITIRWPAPDFASGWTGDPVFLPETSQQVLVVQHPGLHAFSVATVEAVHDRAESGIAATGNITAIASDTVILLSTAPA
jgi:hypothetical protein